MSSNRELMFVERSKDKWYYILEDYSGCDFDWMDTARAYGPFGSLDDAQYHQYDLSRISTSSHEVQEFIDYRRTEQMEGLFNAATLDRAY